MSTLTTTKYQIRYQHTSWGYSASMYGALRKVRQEARVPRLFTANTPDGLYCYRSKAEKDADDTGANAFAVICTTEGEAQ